MKRLEDELDFIKNFSPYEQEKQVIASMFEEMLSKYKSQLVTYYDVHDFKSTDDLYVMHSGRAMFRLWAKLEESGLASAIPPRMARKLDRSDQYILNLRVLHPQFAFIYMEALATRMASHRQLHPVTDNVRDHVLVGRYTIERLTQALLQPDNPQPYLGITSPTSQEIEVQIATIALQSILPKGIAHIPIGKIIQFRKKHRDELTAFQDYLHEIVSDVQELQFKDLEALKAHLEVAYEKKIKPQVDALKKCFTSLGMDTITGVLNVKVTLPPLLTSAGEYLAQAHVSPANPIIIGTGALSFSVLTTIQRARKEASQFLQSLPAAYLLYTKEDLGPTNIISQVTHNTRKMLFGV